MLASINAPTKSNPKANQFASVCVLDCTRLLFIGRDEGCTGASPHGAPHSVSYCDSAAAVAVAIASREHHMQGRLQHITEDLLHDVLTTMVALAQQDQNLPAGCHRSASCPALRADGYDLLHSAMMCPEARDQFLALALNLSSNSSQHMLRSTAFAKAWPSSFVRSCARSTKARSAARAARHRTHWWINDHSSRHTAPDGSPASSWSPSTGGLAHANAPPDPGTQTPDQRPASLPVDRTANTDALHVAHPSPLSKPICANVRNDSSSVGSAELSAHALTGATNALTQDASALAQEHVPYVAAARPGLQRQGGRLVESVLHSTWWSQHQLDRARSGAAGHLGAHRSSDASTVLQPSMAGRLRTHGRHMVVSSGSTGAMASCPEDEAISFGDCADTCGSVVMPMSTASQMVSDSEPAERPAFPSQHCGRRYMDEVL
jgi:hypothetical protein